ncbi:MAG: hypothetical protein LAT63_15130 [Marinobacter sp.]|nr:hypothetical protein [Marinobacter sp.]
MKSVKRISGFARGLSVAVLMPLLFWLPAAHAHNDLDVTMRMVLDDEELAGSMVQELQLPELLLRDDFANFDRADIRDVHAHAQALARQAESVVADVRSDVVGGVSDAARVDAREALEATRAELETTLDSVRADLENAIQDTRDEVDNLVNEVVDLLEGALNTVNSTLNTLLD